MIPSYVMIMFCPVDAAGVSWNTVFSAALVASSHLDARAAPSSTERWTPVTDNETGSASERDDERQPRTRLHHTHLFASDLDASLDFYRRWFGAEVLGDEVFAGSRNVLVAIGDGRLNFYDQPPRDRGRNVVHHLGIQTEDLEDLVRRMQEGGVVFRKPITDTGPLSYVMVEGPDGILLELFQADPDDHEGGARQWFTW